ncbi:MAG: PPE family protein [Mycobacteriaceae bacterium]|nr:PPE family protein [Mycobacteriaceae bacterium]
MDYGALPPEINSGRMYCGPGAEPMLTAAAAWDALSIDLYATAAACHAAISGLAFSWTGPAATAMAQATALYLTWLSSTAAQAEQAAVQAKAAAGAYETAFAMTVPPPIVAANRVMLTTLIMTNFFGQNAPAIAAVEAEYAEMWAQDAVAMYCYASSSAAASVLTPFSQPPPTVDPTGISRQVAAVAHAAGHTTGLQVYQVMSHGPESMSLAPSALRSLAAPALGSSSRKLLTMLLSPTRTAHHMGSWSRNAATSTNFLTKATDKIKKRVEDRIKEKIRDTVLGLGPGPAAGTHRLGLLDLPGLGSQLKTALYEHLGHGHKLGELSVPPSWLSQATSPLPAELPANG